ncbi:hypothetical protein [Niabella aquatica]
MDELLKNGHEIFASSRTGDMSSSKNSLI